MTFAEFWTNLTPAHAAALGTLVTTVISIISLAVSVRTSRKVAARAATLSEELDTRNALRALVGLSTRVHVSLSRMVQLAAAKAGDELVVDAMDTLGIVSDFFADTADEKTLGFPQGCVNRIREMRQTLTKYLVLIDYEQATSTQHLESLYKQNELIAGLIEHFKEESAP